MLNLNETAVLGLLANKARYGYELDKVIEEKLVREWTDIAFSSIYAILKSLEEKRCVDSEAEIAGNRVRRHYTITRLGRKALKASVTHLLSEPIKASDSLMAGLANIDLLPDEEVKDALKQRAAALKNQLEMIEKTGNKSRGKDKDYFDVLAKRAKSRVSEELRFVEDVLNETPVEKALKAATAEATRTAEAAPEQRIVAPAQDKEESRSREDEETETSPEESKHTLF
jgi:DNA-binding PadR family transcriptional regulator